MRNEERSTEWIERMMVKLRQQTRKLRKATEDDLGRIVEIYDQISKNGNSEKGYFSSDIAVLERRAHEKINYYYVYGNFYV